MAIRVTISLTRETLDRVDRVRGDVPRSKFVERSLEAMLQRLSHPTQASTDGGVEWRRVNTAA